jgi:hypothetical protein
MVIPRFGLVRQFLRVTMQPTSIFRIPLGLPIHSHGATEPLTVIAASNGVKKLGPKEGRTKQVGDVRLTWKTRGEDTGFATSFYEMDCGTVIRNDACLVPHYLLRECGMFACPLSQKGNSSKRKLRWTDNVKNLTSRRAGLGIPNHLSAGSYVSLSVT